MSFHHRKMHARYNDGADTRPTAPGGVNDYDPKRPGGALNGGPREGSHSFNNKPATTRRTRGRG